MLRRLKTYNVYIKKDAGEPLETAVFVPEGFSLWAFLLHVFWALWHRSWSFAAFCLVALSIVQLASMGGMIALPIAAILEFGLRLWIGFEANDWHAATLEKQGYVLYDIASGYSEPEAQQRFLDRQLMPQKAAPALAVSA